MLRGTLLQEVLLPAWFAPARSLLWHRVSLIPFTAYSSLRPPQTFAPLCCDTWVCSASLPDT